MRSGIALLDELSEHRRSDSYGRMLAADDAFLAEYGPALRRFVLRWGRQPMRLWSRQWEYPYAAEQILQFASEQDNRPLRILDAGCGVTFFPYYMCSRLENAEFICCDGNPAYVRLFDRMARAGASKAVTFMPAMLQSLPLEADSLDVVCCISVLEHTDDFPAILDEFARVLRPGGLLVLTFDISLDGRTEIPREKARDLLRAVAERFDIGDQTDLPGELSRLDEPESILTTDAVRAVEPEMLPWRWPLLKSIYDFFRGCGLTGGFFSLTFFCLAARAVAAPWSDRT